MLPDVSGATTLSVSPNYFEIQTAPGSSEAHRIGIYNTGKVPMTVRVYGGDFWYDAKGQRSFPSPGTSPFSAATWLSLPSEPVVVAPGSHQEISVILAVPKPAPKSAYATVFVEQLAASEAKTLGVSLRIAVPILYQSPGTEIESLSLKEMNVQEPTKFQPLVVKFQLENTDETYVFPKGTVMVMKQPGPQLVAKNELEGTRVVLPKQSLSFEVPLTVEATSGAYEGLLTLFYGKDKHIVRKFGFSIP